MRWNALTSGVGRRGAMNRNGFVGQFEDFVAKPRSLDELLASPRRQGEPPKESSDLSERDGWSLVRYRIGTDETWAAMDAVGARTFSVTAQEATYTALFGVVSPEGRVGSIVHVVDDKGDEGPRISFLHEKEGVPRDVMAAFLRELDVPASWRAGSDASLRERYDLAWTDGAGWEDAPARHYVRATYKRICFATRPTLTESVDVLLPVDPEANLAATDEEEAYLAKNRYVGAGFEELGRLGYGVRAGFSSWLPEGDPVLVKIVNGYLDRELALIDEAAEISASASPEP